MAQPALKPVPSFDTGRTIKSFTDANIDQATAEAITEGLDNALQHTATKVEMHALHKETKSDLEFLRQEMVGKVVEVNNNINLLRKDMEKSEIKTEAEFKLVYEKIDSSKKNHHHRLRRHDDSRFQSGNRRHRNRNQHPINSRRSRLGFVLIPTNRRSVMVSANPL